MSVYDDLLNDELEEIDSGDELAVGIDLGTTNSVLAIVENGHPVVVADESGHKLHSSIVGWLPNGQRLVGPAARGRRVIDPKNTVYSAKRFIGQPFRAQRVQAAISQLPYEVVEGESQEALIKTREGTIGVPQVAAYVLDHLKAIAEKHTGRAVKQAVITVPANFTDGQRAATRHAAELAGLEVLRILNEPTAAALAYGRERAIHQRIAVFDLGGGTFDISLLAVRDDIYEVLATGGDPFLGGDDVDKLLADRLAHEFLKLHRIDPNADPIARAKLLVAAEQIKMRLSQDLVVEGNLSEVAHGAGGKPLALPFRVERAELEAMIEPIVARAMEFTTRVLAEAGITPEQVDEVILVGGSTRLPVVQRRVAAAFGRTPRVDINPMEVVALGAAMQAEALCRPGRSAGVLLDITPHSLRVATAGGFSRSLIAKNTPIPTEGVATFFTARDNQPSVRIKVCQGEFEKFDDNVPLGELVLDDLPPARRGELSLQVSFTIDADGLLQVAARETRTGRSTRAELSTIGSSGPR